MFISKTRGGYGRGMQWGSGNFLILFSIRPASSPCWLEHGWWNDVEPVSKGYVIRAVMRYVRLEQCGHFMMGAARLFGRRVGLSGAYGGDGLTCDGEDLTQAEWNSLVELPVDLQDRFWQGGGHNTAGSEGPDVRQWAKSNEGALMKAGKLSGEENKRVKRAVELFGFYRPGIRVEKDGFEPPFMWAPPVCGTLVRVQPDLPGQIDGPWHGVVQLDRERGEKHKVIKIVPDEGWRTR